MKAFWRTRLRGRLGWSNLSVPTLRPRAWSLRTVNLDFRCRLSWFSSCQRTSACLFAYSIALFNLRSCKSGRAPRKTCWMWSGVNEYVVHWWPDWVWEGEVGNQARETAWSARGLRSQRQWTQARRVRCGRGHSACHRGKKRKTKAERCRKEACSEYARARTHTGDRAKSEAPRAGKPGQTPNSKLEIPIWSGRVNWIRREEVMEELEEMETNQMLNDFNSAFTSGVWEGKRRLRSECK